MRYNVFTCRFRELPHGGFLAQLIVLFTAIRRRFTGVDDHTHRLWD